MKKAAASGNICVKGDSHPAPSFFRSIRGRLVLLLVIILVPVILLQFFIDLDRLNARRYSELQSNMKVARATARAFDNFIQHILLQEKQIAFALTSFHVPKCDLAQPFPKGIDRSFPDLEHISIISPSGCIVASNYSALVGMDVSDRSYFREIIKGKEWVVSELVHSKADGRAKFAVSSPIRDESGERIGVIAVAVDGKKLKNSLSLERFDGDLTILDNTGRAVYRYPPTAWNWDERDFAKIDPRVRESLSGKEVMDVSSNTIDKRLRILAMAPVRSIGWVSRASIPEAKALSGVYKQIYRNAALFLFVVVGSLLAAVLISRRISVPIEKLIGHARSLKEGEWSHAIVEKAPSEIEEFAATFNSMAEEIRRREAQLEYMAEDARKWAVKMEQKVQERTADLQMANANLKILSSRILTAQEEERKAVARELHDTVLQRLAYTKLSLGMSLKRMLNGGPPPDQEFVEEINSQTVESIGEVRSIMENMTPSMLKHFGLIETLEGHCHEFRERYPLMKLETEFDLSDDEIPEELNFPIFRVLQEALNNAAKHSRASRVKASLNKEADSIRLRVSDNGGGFEPDRELHSSKPGGFGLTSMKERAELFGGSFLISSQKGRGTVVTASWSLSRLVNQQDVHLKYLPDTAARAVDRVP